MMEQLATLILLGMCIIFSRKYEPKPERKVKQITYRRKPQPSPTDQEGEE